MSLWCRLGIHTWQEYASGKSLYRRCFTCPKRQRFVPTDDGGWVDDPVTPDYLKDCKGGDEHDGETPT